jgi:hypothetical protein
MNRFFMCPVLFLSLLLISCGTYPQFRTKVSYRYSQAPLTHESAEQTKEAITIEDIGASEKIIQPIKVQKCNGSRLAFKTVTKYRYSDTGKKIPYEAREPVFETVDPLANIYLRRIRIRNTTEHVLQLTKIDVVFVDPSGNEYEMVPKEFLGNFILSNRPCTSSESIISALQPLQLILGRRTRIRPQRDQEFLLAFPNLTTNIPGEWRLELHNFPTQTDRAGNISRKTSFEFPIEVTKYKITVKQRKDGFIDRWKEIGRKEELASY